MYSNAIIGIASAAAVLTLIALVLRGQKTGRPNTAPSKDFEALLMVSKEPGPVGTLACRIRERVDDPWSWSICNERIEDDRRAILNAFAEKGLCSVSRIQPKAGEPFDPYSMTPNIPVTPDDCWVVSSEVPAESAGFRVGNRVDLLAKVNVCTIDWWVLANPNSLVGQTISERANDLVVGGASGAARWRAPWGLTHPEDLRELFEEKDLNAWRIRVIDELNPHYQGNLERCLLITGAAGDVFESSTMETEGPAPVGDATVTEVVERQGLAQQGLACPGGSPILLAVVRTQQCLKGRR
jgi:hypothetical protein